MGESQILKFLAVPNGQTQAPGAALRCRDLTFERQLKQKATETIFVLTVTLKLKGEKQLTFSSLDEAHHLADVPSLLVAMLIRRQCVSSLCFETNDFTIFPDKLDHPVFQALSSPGYVRSPNLNYHGPLTHKAAEAQLALFIQNAAVDMFPESPKFKRLEIPDHSGLDEFVEFSATSDHDNGKVLPLVLPGETYDKLITGSHGEFIFFLVNSNCLPSVPEGERHRVTEESVQRYHSFQCDHCPFVSHQLCLYKEHVDVQHNFLVIFCKECPRTFSMKAHLRSHQTRCHQRRDHVCEVCDAAFKTKNKHDRHYEAKHGTRSIPCDDAGCHAVFASVPLMQMHKSSMHGKKIHCSQPDCAKGFIRSNDFVHHLYMVHNMANTPVKKCVEPACEFRSPVQAKIQAHWNNFHQSVFECIPCKKKSSSKSNFSMHLRTIRHRNTVQAL